MFSLKNKANVVFFVSLSVAAFLFHYGLGNLNYSVVPDTASYLQSYKNETTNFSGPRVPLYGFFLKILEDRYSIIPYINFLLLMLAAYSIYKAAETFGMSREAGIAMSILIPFSMPAVFYLSYVHPEIPALSFLLMHVARVLILSSRQRWNIFDVFLLMILAGLSYFLKPSNLMSLMLIPYLIPLFSIIKDDFSYKKIAVRMSTYLIIVSFPFLLYSGARWAHDEGFNLVSYAGYNSVGMSSQLLEREEQTWTFSDTSKDYGKYLLSEKERLITSGVILGVPLNSTDRQRVLHSSLLGYFDIHARDFDQYLSIASRYKKERGLSWSEFDRRMQKFSFEVVSSLPFNYLAYVGGATIRYIGLLIGSNPILLVLGFISFMLSVRGFSTYKCALLCRVDQTVIIAVTLLFVFVNMLPSILISFPAKRYVDVGGIFIHSLFLYYLVVNVNYHLKLRRHR